MRLLKRLAPTLLLALPALTATAQSTPVTVTYGHESPADQVMDIYWPASPARATVLFIHGGSLQQSGERRSSPAYRDVCLPFVRAGVACATMDYRLAPAHQWPAMPADVAAATAALKKLLAAGKGDPKNVFLFGHSSGCHLAAIVGTNATFLKAVGLDTKDIAGIIPMGCILDRDDATLRGLTADRIRASFMKDGQDVATFGTPENYLAANPASFVGSHVPPTLIIVADAERFMPPVMEQGARFVRLLLENGVPANLVVVPGKHMSSIAAIGKPDDPAFAAIMKFIFDPLGSAAAH
jgi:acetyl esterase/lipase